ncbi:MAG: endonuclease/exonuclease/phosphatase family protein, partial [Deltaproteobacteria bacterium]|nr:endonuclease/exonuclease/phosphatase family protein [Deltaproteobacteria bacterium]
GIEDHPDNVAAVMVADADIVLLQESTVGTEEGFREVFAETYPHILFQECCRAGGLGLMSKHPIVEEDYLEPKGGWFPAWRVVLDTPLGTIQTLNVHLRPPMSDGGSWVSGYFSTRGVRRDEIEGFWTSMDASMTTIVAGDFNENASGRAIAFLADKGLTSALPQLHPNAKTWRWQTRVGKIRAQLDHVVYGRGLALQSAEVLESGRSDHFPVLVVLGAATTPESKG